MPSARSVAHAFNILTLLGVLMTSQASSPAQAGQLNQGTWQASGCGTLPTPPQLDDIRNDDGFNKGVDAVNTYRKSLRTYLECGIKEAQADAQVINKSASALQQTIKEADAAIVSAITEAEKKLK